VVRATARNTWFPPKARAQDGVPAPSLSPRLLYTCGSEFHLHSGLVAVMSKSRVAAKSAVCLAAVVSFRAESSAISTEEGRP
jgi:hypothetical protein